MLLLSRVLALASALACGATLWWYSSIIAGQGNEPAWWAVAILVLGVALGLYGATSLPGWRFALIVALVLLLTGAEVRPLRRRPDVGQLDEPRLRRY